MGKICPWLGGCMFWYQRPDGVDYRAVVDVSPSSLGRMNTPAASIAFLWRAEIRRVCQRQTNPEYYYSILSSSDNDLVQISSRIARLKSAEVRMHVHLSMLIASCYFLVLRCISGPSKMFTPIHHQDPQFLARMGPAWE